MSKRDYTTNTGGTITLKHTSAQHSTTVKVLSVVHWHSARRAWNGYQPSLGSIPRPGRI